MTPAWLARLRCPRTHRGGLTISCISERAGNGLPSDGYLICEAAGTIYDTREGVLDLRGEFNRSSLTFAGCGNEIPLTAFLYEHLRRYRPHASAARSRQVARADGRALSESHSPRGVCVIMPLKH